MADDDNATANPWLRDDNRYTFDAISAMPRSEFDRRRELHLIYGTADPDQEIDSGAWNARALRITSSLQEYMDQYYHPDDYELFNEPAPYKIFINTHGAGPGFAYQRRREDVDHGLDAADPLMGDGTDEGAIDQTRKTTRARSRRLSTTVAFPVAVQSYCQLGGAS